MSLEVQFDGLVVPGTLLGSGMAAGPGTYKLEANDQVFASVVGKVQVKTNTKAKAKTEGKSDSDSTSKGHEESVEGEGLMQVSVVGVAAKPQVVPVLHSIVTCRVVKVTPRFAATDILCVGTKTIQGTGFKGIIRKENVRSFEVDKVELHNSFRPGDIVRAQVASLGTARSYELSTAQMNLGVVSALSAAEEPMIGISHDQMKCPVTGVIEKRKVAKLEEASG